MSPGSFVAIAVGGVFAASVICGVAAELVRQHNANVREAGFQCGVAVERARWHATVNNFTQRHPYQALEHELETTEQELAGTRFFNLDDWNWS